MGLVDYSSSDEEDDSNEHAPATTALPPLPRVFHDLYAATVRNATADDPSLHQGRHRAIPHVAGQWPSHLYIEWFPSMSEHAYLGQLLASLGNALGQGAFHSFLTSDLGAPLPLHISLSRPFVLTTAKKTGFLADLTNSITTSGVSSFDVKLAGLDWFRSPDSARAFLVLRAVVNNDGQNGPLVTLLNRCNEQVTEVGQPALYAKKSGGDDNAASAFHVSVAWTLAADTESWAADTQQVYKEWLQGAEDKEPLTIPVDSIKVKIGNVVTDLPLRKASVSGPNAVSTIRRPSTKRTRSGEDSIDATENKDAKQPSSKKSHIGNK
ncbi:poly(U)-specific 3'-to-5' RNA exonuclease [Sporothrix eucalyptigena]|uniref:U6 snRNA phosphodiesterase n=1 Tax=Sporothrix eucalyptigena TaxID=1812306 RepID=A0ABP0D2G5_9PEZI